MAAAVSGPPSSQTQAGSPFGEKVVVGLSGSTEDEVVVHGAVPKRQVTLPAELGSFGQSATDLAAAAAPLWLDARKTGNISALRETSLCS